MTAALGVLQADQVGVRASWTRRRSTRVRARDGPPSHTIRILESRVGAQPLIRTTMQGPGDTSFTLPELVAAVSGAAGKPVAHDNMRPEAFKAAAIEAGAPDFIATTLSTNYAGVAM